MTVTVPRWGAVLAIALVGVLGGLAIGQVTRADSAPGPSANASYVSGFERNVKEINKTLKEMHTVLGSGLGVYTVLDEIKSVNTNTYQACRAVASYGCQP
jgi:hypothetical protein